jgi:hypothetical protein
LDEIKFWHEEPVEFSILIPKNVDSEELAENLRQAGIEVLQYNRKTSDYMNCKATRKVFTKFFGAKLKWRTMKIGSWELADDSYLPEHVLAKEVLLNRNILFPRTFIKNWQLKKKDESKK